MVVTFTTLQAGVCPALQVGWLGVFMSIIPSMPDKSALLVLFQITAINHLDVLQLVAAAHSKGQAAPHKDLFADPFIIEAGNVFCFFVADIAGQLFLFAAVAKDIQRFVPGISGEHAQGLRIAGSAHPGLYHDVISRVGRRVCLWCAGHQFFKAKVTGILYLEAPQEQA